MDPGRPRVDTTTAVHILRRTALWCSLVCACFLILPAAAVVINWGDRLVVLRSLPEMMVPVLQLLAIGVMASAVFAVSGPFPETWKLSADVWAFAALTAALSALGIFSSGGFFVFPPFHGLWDVLSKTPVNMGYWLCNVEPFALYGVCLPLGGVALGLWVWVRVRHGWRWPGAGAGHLLAAGTLFIYGGVLSVAALVFWPTGLGVAAVCAYGVCYALGLATIRADEFEAACRPRAGRRPRPPVWLAALLLALSVGASVPCALAIGDRLLHPGIIY